MEDEDSTPTEDNNYNWNDKLEVLVSKIGKSCSQYKRMHFQAARISSSKYFWLMIMGMVLPSASGTMSAVSVALNDDKVMPICAAVTGCLSSIIVAIAKFGNFDDVSTSHRQAETRFLALETNILRQLALYRNDRVNAGKYINWLENRYEEITSTAPLLPTDINVSKHCVWSEMSLQPNNSKSDEIRVDIPTNQPNNSKSDEIRVDIPTNQPSLKLQSEKVSGSINTTDNIKLTDKMLQYEMDRLSNGNHL